MGMDCKQGEITDAPAIIGNPLKTTLHNGKYFLSQGTRGAE